ncbi:MAG: hypothetical protein ACXWLS_00100 [Myxococcaceae bacterium]
MCRSASTNAGEGVVPSELETGGVIACPPGLAPVRVSTPLGPGVTVELPVLFGSGTVRELGLLGWDVDWASARPETSTAAASNDR